MKADEFANILLGKGSIPFSEICEATKLTKTMAIRTLCALEAQGYTLNISDDLTYAELKSRGNKLIDCDDLFLDRIDNSEAIEELKQERVELYKKLNTLREVYKYYAGNSDEPPAGITDIGIETRAEYQKKTDEIRSLGGIP